MLIKKIKNIIFDNLSKEIIDKDKLRYEYETNKFRSDDFKILISPGTDFMDKLKNILSSESFYKKTIIFYQNYNNLQQILVHFLHPNHFSEFVYQ